MLKRSWLAAALPVAFLAAAAQAQDDADGLQRPERLTIGTSDQFLGVLSPNDKTLYYASTRNTTSELYSLDLASGASTLMFDEGADVTWPRVSPDGKQLLYVSYREDAAGRLCVRRLPKADGRRCLAEGSGAVQAQWLDPARILLLSRPSTEGDMRVSIIEVGRRLAARTLFDRNLTGPAISPDGRWLLYTPLERYVERIGPGFAAKAAPTLAAQRLDRPEAAPLRVELDVPGLTGQAAFALDGKSIYFVQFIADSNHDGVIDADDHGVLFRVPFEPSAEAAPTALGQAVPQQLTDASWNCQYPSPSDKRLIATCARGGHLDVYGLPLAGMVPPDWDLKRLRAEADVTTNENELLLLHTQILRLEPDPTRRRNELVDLMRLHLRLDQFEPAEHHARHLAAIKDKHTAGLGTATRLLCEHRRALRARERGHLDLDFAENERQRIEKLGSGKSSTPGGDAARHLVRSEIADALGDKTLARTELEAVSLEGLELSGVLQLYADRADALYRELDEREPLVAAYLKLAEHPALSDGDRVGYARAAVRAATRGLSDAEADSALSALVAAPGSDLGFAITLARAVRAVKDARPSEAVQKAIFDLYTTERRPERRRAIVLDAVQRGYERDAQPLIEHLAELYVKDVPKGTAERRRAARMYKRLIEDRAYARLGEGKQAEARDDFLAVARSVGSLESWAGYFDRRMKEGATVEALEAEYEKMSGDKNGPVDRFVRAYLLARKIPKLGHVEANRNIDQAMALVRGAWPQLKDKPEALAVFGAVLQERYLHDHDRAAAQRATAVYLIALDLARRNPRYKAMLLGQMAQLQAQVGNWRIALDYFDQREKFPFVDNLAGLAHRLIKARTLLHVDREGDAAKLAEDAVAVVERTPKMASFHALVLDRAALYNLAADRFDRALALYERLVPLVDAERGPVAARNRVVAHLALAAAALGAQKPALALSTLTGVEQALATPGIGPALRWPHSTEVQVATTYRLIAEGLRAKAHLALGNYAEAQKALESRRSLYEAALHRGAVDEHVRALALVDGQLAELALRQKDSAGALAHVKASIDRLDPLLHRDQVAVDRDQLVLLWLASEARLTSDTRAQLKLRDRLGKGIEQLALQGEPKHRSLQRWLEIYLGLLVKPATGVQRMRTAAAP